MAKFCQPDRTPCKDLTAQLGVSIFADLDSQRFYILTSTRDGVAPFPLALQYCPFCGCRLAEMPFHAGERIKLKQPKKRKNGNRAKATLKEVEEDLPERCTLVPFP